MDMDDLFTHSPVDGQVELFKLGVFINKATLYFFVHIC